MKNWYKIGLFFICIIIVCLIFIILWKRHSYPNESAKQQEIQDIDIQAKMSQANQTNVIITSDTICIYEEMERNNGTVRIEEVPLPEKYIGMTRQELEQALKNEDYISVEDQENGLVSQQLGSFSSEKITIIRIFNTTVKEQGYYIMAQEQCVSVFRADKQTLYFQTGILLEELPLSVQEEILQGKYMDSEMEVFHFLESYSS